MIGLIPALAVLFLPGMVLLALMKEKFSFSLASVLSIALTGIIFYVLSYVVVITFWLVLGYAVVFVALAVVFREKIFQSVEGNELLSNKSPQSRIALAVLVVVSVLAVLLLIFTPDMSFDSLSYHLPLINQFAEQGQIHAFENPANTFEIRATYFPLLFESLVGLVKLVSPLFLWKIIPWLAFINCFMLIYFISRELDGKNFFSPIFFFLSFWLFVFSATFYLDVFLTMLFLASIYFLFRFRNCQKTSLLLVSGFLIGLTVAVKFTALFMVISFLGFLAALLFFRKVDFKSLPYALAGLALGAGFFLLSFFSKPYISSFKLLGKYGVTPGAEPLMLLIYNSLRFFVILGAVFLLNKLHLLVLFLVLAFFLSDQNNKSMKAFGFFTLIYAVVFFVSSVFSEPTATGLPRYFFPVFALFCVAAGIAFKRILERKDFIAKAFLAAAIAVSLVSFYFIASYSVHQLSWGEDALAESYVNGLYRNIPNTGESHVFFANTPNPLVFGLEKTVISDFTSFDFGQAGENPCAFLKAEGVNRIVFFYPSQQGIRKKLDINGFLSNLLKQLQAGDCGEKVYSEEGWMDVYVVD